MSLILHIDSATEIAQVSLSKDAFILFSLANEKQNDHASFIQPAIAQLIKLADISLSQIDAIAITAGPGSYTGLRVGMASAKGLCYALQKPLITLNTLEVMAASAIDEQNEVGALNVNLFCPMIDARRMEVFTAIYNQKLDIVLPNQALLLEPDSYSGLLKEDKILFFGSAVKKWQELCKHPHALFASITIKPASMARLAEYAVEQQRFADLALSEPFYGKEFHSASNK